MNAAMAKTYSIQHRAHPEAVCAFRDVGAYAFFRDDSLKVARILGRQIFEDGGEPCLVIPRKAFEGERRRMQALGTPTTVLEKAGKDDWKVVSRETSAYDLSRFEEAHAIAYESALQEIRAGLKETHWIWYVFPQIAGLGRSATSMRYAIKNLDEAKAYLDHPVLGAHYRECCRELLAHADKSTAAEIFGELDAMKVRSSMTLFLRTGFRDARDLCRKVLDVFYDGEEDALTLRLLGVA